MKHFAMAALLLAGLSLTISCGKSPDAPEEKGPAVQIVAGSGLRDTIGALPAQGLVVRVLGANGPEAGVAVDFQAVPRAGCSDPYGYGTCVGVQVAAANSSSFGTTASGTTDAAGRAVVRVRLGSTATTARLVATVPVYGLADTADYTIDPGAAGGLVVSPRDTALEVGGSYTFGGKVRDRASNPRPDPVTYESSSGAATVNTSGAVSAAATGRAYIRVRATVAGQTLVDSGGVTVVPVARIAAAGYNGPLTLSNLTGGQRKTLVTGRAIAPDWAPSGDRIIYFDDNGLAVVDTLGTSTRLVTPGLSYVGWAQYSADGQWIYFEAYELYYTGIYRMHPDGTGLTRLTPTSSEARRPSPAPDGTRVAYVTYNGVAILDLRTGTSTTVPGGGASSSSMVRWSPDGQWLAVAYYSSSYLIRPDGTGKRQVTSSGSAYYQAVTWSPDSKWALFGGSGNFSLVDAASGAGWPVPVSGYYPAWKR